MLVDKNNLKNISAAVSFYAKKQPDKPYIISLTNKIKYTYSQVDMLVNQVCYFYQTLGVKQGSIISAVLKNDIEYIVMYLASLRYGAVFNPYPYSLEAKDIIRYLSFLNPFIVFCQKQHYEEFKAIGHHDVCLIEESFFENKVDGIKPYEDFDPGVDSMACIYYSSGTTGNPKNIIISFRNMVVNTSSLVRGFGINKEDVHLIVLPLGHTAAINYSFLPCTLSGATIILAESFWKIRSKFWTLIKEYKITYVELVPSILFALLNTPYSREEYLDIDSLRFIGCGSSTLPRDRQIQFIKKYGVKVANLYGLSETGPTHVDYPLTKDWEPGSIGVPLDCNEVGIVNEEGAFVGISEIGEFVIKGENVFMGYFGNQTLYNQVVRNGYFHTGDLGYRDEKGKHFFVGRKKELIIKGGVNIAPDEIDEILYKMAEVEEALTVGKPDAYMGEKICAYIVTKAGSCISEDEVFEHCRNYLSKDKIPDSVVFVQEIPKGHSGKMLRRRL